MYQRSAHPDAVVLRVYIVAVNDHCTSSRVTLQCAFRLTNTRLAILSYVAKAVVVTGSTRPTAINVTFQHALFVVKARPFHRWCLRRVGGG